MGIYGGLRRARHEVAFVCAADMPFLDEKIIRSQFLELGAFDIVVPCPRKRPEFLHAFYRRQCLSAIRENLDADIFKIEMLVPRCKTLHLGNDWFAKNDLVERIDRAFTNITTMRDYRLWLEQGSKTSNEATGSNALTSIVPKVLQEIRQTLIEQETAFKDKSTPETFSSIWSHSSRVARIAHHIAKTEGWEEKPALLAGLLHDIGKFAHGSYHEDDTPEEENAVRFAQRILSGTVYEKWLPIISEAILSTYLEGKVTSDIGRAVYDADCLDKLGSIGVVQFVAKKALRRQFLDDDVMIRTSVELTYAHHAPDTLKTATGRSLSRKRKIRTRAFYSGLLEAWKDLGLGKFNIIEEDIAGIVCIPVVPGSCSCGGGLDRESDIRDSLKCRSVVVNYLCGACGFQSEFSFCLPNVSGLPQRQQETTDGRNGGRLE